MSEAELLKVIADYLQEKQGTESGQVKMETSIVDDLKLDSLDTIEMILAMEEHFKTQIPDEVAGEWQTVGDIVKFLTASPVTPLP
jgi:acyl carrier protein